MIFIQGLIFGYKYLVFKRTNNDIIKNISKWPLIFAILCWIFCLLSDMTPIFEMNDCNVFFKCNKNTMEFLSAIFFIAGIINMYLYLLYHLYYGYKNSQYSISLGMVIMFTLLLVIFGVSFGSVYILKYIYKGWDIEGDYSIIIILLIISGSSKLILSLLLLVLFIYKLCKMGSNISSEFNMKSERANNLQNLIELKQDFENDIERMSLNATKLFSLSIIMILSVIVDIILPVLGLVLNHPPLLGKVSYTYSPLERIILPWLIMLTFDFMDSWYKCCFLNIFCCNSIKEWCTLRLRENARFSFGRRFNGVINA